MKILPLVRGEFARIWSSRMGRLSLVALMTTPLFYGGLYLWGNQDPYSNLDRVPAALVVADTGTTVDGSAENYGREAADALLDDGSFGWHEVSATDAAAGVENGTYDFALEFPAAFSTDLASASSSGSSSDSGSGSSSDSGSGSAAADPVRASLVLRTNDANSYLSTTIAKQAAATVRTELLTQVGSAATQTLLDSIGEIRDGVVDASDGAAKLATGASDAADGASSLADGTGRLASGAAELADGTARVSSGAADLASGATSLSGGAKKLASNAATLASGVSSADRGAADLATGTAQLSTGAATLSSGLETIDTSVDGLPASASALATGADQVSTGIANAATSSTQLATGAGQVSSGLAAFQSAVGAALPPSAQTQLAALVAGARSASSGAAQLATGLGTLSDGATRVATGAGALSASAPALASGVHSAATGASDLSSGAATAASGAASLHAGTRKLAAGTTKLAAGATKLSAGASDAADGASKLATGAASAASGASTLSAGAASAASGADSLASGTTTLSSGATKLSDALADAEHRIPAQTTAQRKAIADDVGDPVAVDQKAVTEASSYGAGLAPFFVSLAAWIGIYALFLILRPLSRRALTAVNRPFRAAFAGWLAPAVLGTVQMVALFGILTLALHLPMANPVGVLLFMALTSVTFAAVVLALNALLGSVGQFLGLILMLIQLVTAGGTFPWQTLPAPLAAIHQVLPMAHAVDGIRSLMYGGSSAQLWGAVGVLLVWFAGALLAAVLAAWKQARSRSLREVRPAAIGG
ncbi:YhgE/Pip domain-containing protein [Galbitalea sp. SE-J8]|uniref:YhgE/Pip family protein n=1 Tax=Galbitalea sp. SE-J8 TaxID=3054952 RepID=UPI00259C6FA1|nr:YhgE/Pip domain-containing protein [Galbitalea sp. SE-J8]MDM4762261.1 YhgE/Pip domain-containing protein [Galbitalea sp. SE-J8]